MIAYTRGVPHGHLRCFDCETRLAMVESTISAGAFAVLRELLESWHAHMRADHGVPGR